MPLPQARSIDDLYTEVEDVDLVLTTDGPLSLALNRRLNRPRLGHFATTPRSLASGEFRPRDDRALFLALIDQLDITWKHASHLVANILGCWAETGDLDVILEYPQFDTQTTRAAIDVIRTEQSAHGDLARYAMPADRDVAVIGESAFTALDRSILPDDYTVVDPFGPDHFEPPAFHVYESATAIVDAVVENVSPATAGNVAVVMDRGGRYPALIEAAFEAANIPYYGGPGFADDQGLRTFLRLLRMVVETSDPRVVDIRPILERLDVHPSSRLDDYRLATVDQPWADRIRELFADIEGSTFDDALAQFSDWHTEPPDLRDELGRLDLLNEPVSSDRLNDFEYYLQAYEVPTRRDDSGVLLADATAAAYVDRPVVFYLGMDAEWTRSIPDRPWIDREAKDREYLRQFQRLIQNGANQYYLVQETVAGEAVTPCLYFNDIFERAFETFTDLEHVPHEEVATGRGTGFDREPMAVDPERVEALSQSTLNTLANCPRDQFFKRAVESPDRSYFRKGNVFHDFAEFYVTHPDLVAETERGDIVTIMVDELGPFLHGYEREPIETECRLGVELLRDYLNAEPPTSKGVIGYARWDDEPNIFAEAFDVSIESETTEQWFEDTTLGGKGKVDLIHSADRLVDYKTGSYTSPSQVLRNADIKEESDTPDFQAPMYLAHHRQTVDGPIDFIFLHFLDLVEDAVAADTAVDVADAEAPVTYHPESFAEFAASREAFDGLIEGVAESNNRRKTLERLGFDTYSAFFGTEGFPDVADRDAVVETDVTEAFIDVARREVGEYKYVTRGCRSAMKQLYDRRERAFFAPDLDAFENYLHEQRVALNEYRRSRFPVGDPNWDRVDNRDCILTDHGRATDE